MKQSLLNSLKGKLLSEAEQLVKQAGHETFSVQNDAAVALVTYPNTVILFYGPDERITSVMAGDPANVTKD